MNNKYIPSPIPYMGNKYKLLKTIIPLFPKECNYFIDLFGGGGCVCANYQGIKGTLYNEINEHIVNLFKMFKENKPEELNLYFLNIINEYELEDKTIIDRRDKDRYKYRQDKFNKLRLDYNLSQERDYKILYLLSRYSINHLIRFNFKGEFNASNGADAYNNKNYEDIINFHDKIKTIKISNNDALQLKIDNIDVDTFIYCDPPYLNTQAVYNEKRGYGGWNINNDYKLFELLSKVNDKKIKFGLSNVFENRGIKNEHLIKWCENNNWKVYHLDRNYNPFSRGNSNTDEVYICNY